jgi:hypothetical protein
MTKKILITGCSYGCGEWSKDPYGITHGGIASYLAEKNYAVKNFSRPGANNCVSLENIKNIHKEFDHVIFLLTSASRDVNSYFPYDSTISALDNAHKIANRDLQSVWSKNYFGGRIVQGSKERFQIPSTVQWRGHTDTR